MTGPLDDLWPRVEATAAAHAARYPGDAGGRQPVHVVYVPADRVRASTAERYGAAALRLLEAHASDGAQLASATGIADADADRVRARVVAKLGAEPIEDLRIDFEDGYGVRTDAEEDGHADAAADALAAMPLPFCGLRVKSFADGGHRRAARTLNRFLGRLLETGKLPDGFVVTLPKVVARDHVAFFAELLGRLESAHGLAEGRLRFEVQIETPQSIYDADGRIALPGIVAAGGGRICAAHFGVYDYTAALGLAPSEQRLDAPACDHARHVMQVALAGTGVRLSDGSTAAVPASETTADVHAAWRLHARNVTRSLRHGFWQGWDLHPAHLVSRFAAVYAFLLPAVDEAHARLTATSRGEAHAGVLDEPATITALEALVRRARECGA